MFQVGDRKLTLQKREGAGRETAFGQTAHEYRMFDENGQKVGWLEVIPSADGKQLYVDNIGGFESQGLRAELLRPSADAIVDPSAEGDVSWPRRDRWLPH